MGFRAPAGSNQSDEDLTVVRAVNRCSTAGQGIERPNKLAQDAGMHAADEASILDSKSGLVSSTRAAV